MEIAPDRWWVVSFLIFTFVPICAAASDPSLVTVFIPAAVISIGLVKFWPVLEGIGATVKVDQPQARDEAPASASAVIVAYLPNEQDIICSTVQHFLTRIRSDTLLRVVVAYNSPFSLPVEDELARIAQSDARLVLMKVPESRSKAENLNAALRMIATPIVGIFDADSRPNADCFVRASDWLFRGYDFVQGSNNVHGQPTALESLVTIEYLLKHHISYFARYRVLGVTYFAGSNGYWRTEVLKELRVRRDAQVEDIDLTVRAMLAGRRLAYDPAIIAWEQSPPSLPSWWNQRVRWARGWAQLLKWHQVDLLRSPLGIAIKCTWTFFLFGRRFVAPAALAVLTAMSMLQALADIAVTRNEVICFAALSVLQVASPWIRILTLTRSTLVRAHFRPPWRWSLLYGVTFPIYDLLIDLTILQGMVALGADRRGWRVTPRSQQERERWRTTGSGPLTSKSTKI